MQYCGSGISAFYDPWAKRPDPGWTKIRRDEYLGHIFKSLVTKIQKFSVADPDPG
jgi:hypothetical protein